MMGSGGMVVMDEDTCMVEVARYFISFTQEESCGKCTPCREGTKHMLDILTGITEGKGQESDIEFLVGGDERGRGLIPGLLSTLYFLSSLGACCGRDGEQHNTDQEKGERAKDSHAAHLGAHATTG